MRIVAIAIGLLCALFTSQVPEFMQQYLQRMGGAMDELNIVVSHFEEDSGRSGYEVTGALQLMTKNPEQLVRDQGTRMKENISRLNRLRQQHAAMKDAGTFGRLSAYLANVDGPINARTWDNYKFAVPLSVEGLLFALIGFLIPFVLIELASIPFRGRRYSEA
jgi:Protein of unknown function (DUF2937)